MKNLIALIILYLLNCAGAHAQATAGISGTVKDATGALIPGVEITVTQTATGQVRKTVTNETGFYALPTLPLGPYRFEAALAGFRTYVQTGITLEVNSNPVLNVTLEVGQVNEQIEVQANAALVETHTVGLGQTMESERILEIPLNGRNVASFVLAGGAAVQVDTTGNRSFAGQPIISSAGSVGFGLAYTLDGANHSNPYDNQARPLPFPDAVQEFKLQTSGLTAENVRGAAVNAVTKSGTNEFHGDLFEFVRNDLYSARQYFATKGSTLKRNQFGGTLGGPIVKNKLFFFGGYQGTTLRQDPSSLQAFVPTAAMLAGDFTAPASAICRTGGNLTLPASLGFAANRIDPVRFSKAAVAIAKQLPQTDDPCGLITYGQKSNESDGQSVGKVDYQLSEKHSLFGRFVYDFVHQQHPLQYTPNNLLNTTGRGFNNLAASYAFGSTYLINPATIDAFRLSVGRENIQRVGASFFGPDDVGIKAYSYVPHYMTLSVTNAFSIGGGTSTPSTFRTTSYDLSDSVSLVRGTHQMAFGGEGGLGRSNSYAHVNSTGNYSFSGQITGLGLADFLLGQVTGLNQSGPNTLLTRQWRFGLYAQDAWKATPKLTVNYGLRWHPAIAQQLQDRTAYNFDYTRFVQGVKSTVFPTAPAGFYYIGDPGFPSGRVGYHNKLLNFGPRLGLAWDPKGDGRTSIRASYGITYEDLTMQFRIWPVTAPPFGQNITLTSSTGGLDNPWSDYPGGNPFPAITGLAYQFDKNSPFASYGSYQSVPYDVKPVSVSSWNLTVQREVASSFLASASYIGNSTLHIWTQRSINPGVYFAGTNCRLPNGTTISGTCSTVGNLNLRRALNLARNEAPFIGSASEYDTGGIQKYHGMLLSLQRRVAKGATFNANYTWAHCIGDGQRSNNGQGDQSTVTYLDPINRRGDTANCGSDRRHVFNLSGIVETPTFSQPILRRVVTGWRLSGLYKRMTGDYLTITDGVDQALNGISNQRPSLVLLDPYLDKSGRPLSVYLNPKAFALPPLGSSGNLGKANIAGPSTWQWDMALSRVFQVREGQRLEFRWEAYNVPNSFRPQDPNTTLNSSTFGQIRSAYEPRIMQIAMKYVF